MSVLGGVPVGLSSASVRLDALAAISVRGKPTAERRFSANRRNRLAEPPSGPHARTPRPTPTCRSAPASTPPATSTPHRSSPTGARDCSWPNASFWTRADETTGSDEPGKLEPELPRRLRCRGNASVSADQVDAPEPRPSRLSRAALARRSQPHGERQYDHRRLGVPDSVESTSTAGYARRRGW